MGNPSYGKGYHTGRLEGLLIGLGIGGLATIFVGLASKSYGKSIGRSEAYASIDSKTHSGRESDGCLQKCECSGTC